MPGTVTKFKELPNRNGTVNRLWQQTYERKFLIRTDSNTDDPISIRGTPGLPTLGRFYQIGSSTTQKATGSLIDEIAVEQTSGSDNPPHSEWIVTCKYGPYDAITWSNNPVEWPFKITFSTATYDKVIWMDLNGNPIRNSAGSRFEDPITIDDNRTIITIVRNEAVFGFDLTLAETYRDTINLAIWNGFPAKTVKCKNITTSENQYDSNSQTYFYAVTYVFEINRDTWTRKILDCGYSDISLVDTTKRLVIRSSDGQPMTEPSLLNGSGHRAPATGATPVFLSFDVFPILDYTVFNLNFALALGRTAPGG